ncbi:SCO5918 family protein [Streptomyces sp. NPDC096012]|uniref:SCO5918 family protein n=1 Tax=Streptomyces sp. NPDC096012 TaxID=3155684 RepID=UPI00336A9E0B
MRCVIARYPFELTKSGVIASMKGVTPELVTGESVTIGRRRYPVKQVGQVITRQDRRDFAGGEVVRAMTRLGFTCHDRLKTAPVGVPTPFSAASSALGGTASPKLGGTASPKG